MTGVLALVALLAITVTAWHLAKSDHVGAFLAQWTVLSAVVFFGIVFFLGGASIVFRGAWLSVAAIAALAVAFLVVTLSLSVGRSSAGIDVVVRSVTLEFRALGNTSSRPTRAVLWAATATLAVAAALSLLGFPKGFEPGAYHIPLGIEFFRTGSLQAYSASGLAADAGYTFTYPANASIWYGFLIQWLPERLISLAQLPFLLIVIPTIYGISRNLGADRPASALASIALISVPMIAFGSFELSSDIAGLAFVGLAVYLLTGHDGITPRSLLIAGLSVGLAFGFKSLHLNTIAILGMFTVWLSWQQHRNSTSIRQTASAATRDALVLATGIGLTAAFWVLRNWMQHGNPLYPVHLGTLFDALGFARAWDYHFGAVSDSELEWVRSSNRWPFYPWEEWHFINQNFKASSGTGAYFAAIAIPAVVIALFRMLSRHREALLGPLLFGAVLTVALWAVQDVRQPRYALALLVFALPVSAWLITRSYGKARRVLEAVAVSSIGLMLFVFLSKQAITFGDRVLYSGQWSRHAYYEYPPAVDRLPEGSVIVNLAPRARNYGLYGVQLTNRVVPTQEARGRIVRKQVVPPAGTQAPLVIELDDQQLTKRGATHVFVFGEATLTSDSCTTFTEIGRMDRNPLNGMLLPFPRLLFEIRPCQLPQPHAQ